MPTKSVLAHRTNTSHQSFANPDNRQKGAGGKVYAVVGRVDSDVDLRFRTFVRFPLDEDNEWDNIKSVESAVIRLTYRGGGDLANGTTSKTAAALVKEPWTPGSGNTYTAEEYRWPDVWPDTLSLGVGGTGATDDYTDIDVTESLRYIAPARVKFPGGKPGLGKANHGWMLRGAPERLKSAAAQYGATTANDSTVPVLVITYARVNTAPTLGVDLWPSTIGDPITGTFTDADAGDSMSRLRIEVAQSANWYVPLATWDFRLAESQAVTFPSEGVWSADIPNWAANIPSGIEYEFRVRAWDSHGEPSEWVTGAPFTITMGEGEVTSTPQNLTTADNLMLMASFSVENDLQPHEHWVFTVTVRDNATMARMWSTTYVATREETLNYRIECPYLGPGIYETKTLHVTYVVTRMPGEESYTDAYASIVITIDPNDPAPEESEEPTTAYSREVPAQRIIIRGMDSQSRGPKGTLAILEDFSNLGVSWYASSPGEIYFTLPVSHPQVSVIEPMVTHYEYQQYRGGKWRSLAYGLIRDFDANERDIVFYGIDYLGLLSWSVEAASQPSSKPRKDMPSSVTGTTGSRYLKKSIRHIIVNQLERARKQNDNSPVKFIEVGRVDSFSSIVTIYASYAERLSFIRSLIDSHKGSQANGEERRSRLRVRWNPQAEGGIGRFQFEALDGVGNDRPAIDLQYGSIIQSYHVIALDDFATTVFGVGKAPNNTTPYFRSASDPGVSQGAWGHVARANFWADIVDANDLLRRSRDMATRMSRVGKRIALGLRVRGIALFDGYDILDSIPVSIEDGVVSTSAYGSGYWTIWGMEYRVYDDGHDEITFVLRPKGDSDDIDPDLIPSSPIHYQTNFVWGTGEPTE